MDRKHVKTFTTGEFAQRFGIKKDTLFYYDKIGLFHPAGVHENGYRYYTMPQLDAFWTIQSLRELNVPIKELEHYLDNPSPQGLLTLSHQQLRHVEQEIQKLEDIRKLLKLVVSQTEEAIRVPFGEVSLVELEAETMLYSESFPADKDTSNEEWFARYDAFMQETGLMGPAYIGSVLSQEDLQSGRFGRIHRLYARSKDPAASLRPAGLYAVTYYKGSLDEIPDYYPHLVQQITEQGLQICGDAYEEYLIHVLAAAVESDFVTKISIEVTDS